MKKHFVRFLSPGTLFSEQSILPIDSWNVDKALEMADTITERYGATPYAFYFETHSRRNKDLDSKITDTSPIHYLGGRIETIDEVRKRKDPNEKILLFNMETNGFDKIVVNENSYRSTHPLREGDIILDYTPPSKR